jgi:hypothetical protein
MLVEMNISVWTARKLDKGETDKVVGSNAAVRNAAKVHKNLMAGTSLLDKINNTAKAMRVWHLARTLPWSDGGQRLLPTSLFLDYKRAANDYQQHFDLLVDEFIQSYPALVQTAQNYLGGLFNPDDYPSVDEVRSKFGVRFTFSPIPESGDFRLDVSAEDLRELSLQYEASFDKRLNDAMREPWDRMHKALTTMTEKLTDKEGDDKKRYHETLIDNVRDLCGLLTHLNVAKDPKLEAARRDVEDMLAGTSIDMIRESALARETTKAKVDAILKQFDW